MTAWQMPIAAAECSDRALDREVVSTLVWETAAVDASDDEADAPRGRHLPSPLMRFLVVVIGALMFGTGRDVQHAGGVVGVSLGVLTQVVSASIIAIASGAVELIARAVRRHDRRADS
jgi:hypothetical protein